MLDAWLSTELMALSRAFPLIWFFRRDSRALCFFLLPKALVSISFYKVQTHLPGIQFESSNLVNSICLIILVPLLSQTWSYKANWLGYTCTQVIGFEIVIQRLKYTVHNQCLGLPTHFNMVMLFNCTLFSKLIISCLSQSLWLL